MADIIPFRVATKFECPTGYQGYCVYIIASETNDLVKIGYTSDSIGRLKALQSGSASKLRIIRLVPGGKRVEGDFHKEFAERRAHGEWFHFLPEMMTFLSKESEEQDSRTPSVDAVENAKALAGMIVNMAEANSFGYAWSDVEAVAHSDDYYLVAEAKHRMRACRIETYLVAAFHELADDMIRENVDLTTEIICKIVTKYAEVMRPHYAQLHADREAEALAFVTEKLNF